MNRLLCLSGNKEDEREELIIFGQTKHYESDIWAIGIVKAPVTDFLNTPLPNDVVWIEPERDFMFLADPHGIWRDGKLYVFVEALDYRIKKGVLECFVLDAQFNILERITVMEQETHLSYPFVLEDEGEIYMIPETSRSGETWIYKAVDFPRKWEKVKSVLPDTPMIDASFVQHEGAWWVFYSLPGSDDRAYKELHIARAECLLGEWVPHNNNPVSEDLALSRPGGRPFVHEGKIHLPVQDCSKHYGGSMALMRIDSLDLDAFSTEKVMDIQPTFHPRYSEGIHTLSACGEVTLIDCKYIDRSPRRKWINAQRRLGRFIPFVRAL